MAYKDPAAQKKYMRRWRSKHKERVNEYKRRWWAKRKKEVAQVTRV